MKRPTSGGSEHPQLRSLVAALLVAASTIAMHAQQPAAPVDAPPLGALAPANLNKTRPAPPFDITGTWLNDLRFPGSWRFGPPPPAVKLKPEAQIHFDAARKAQAEGKVYRDDIGQCWPAGLPMIMTRVWPIAMVQKPTVIYMVSGFMNSFRTIFLDGRPHSDPDVVVRSFNGESIGRWEKDTLVVDTRYFVGHHHWIDSGVPASDELHIVERIKMVNNGAALEIEYTLTDPKGWEGEMKFTKRWNRVDDQDIQEVQCLPDLNQHIPSTQSKDNVR
jgi:hypothetical protein